MKPSIEAKFKQDYAKHLQHLTLKGLQPKTIDAYARGIRRIGDYFEGDIHQLSKSQLIDYFVQLLGTHSWSAVKLDLYGLRFFYQHVLNKPLGHIDLVKPPKASRLPDIVTTEEAARIFASTRKLSYRVFFFTVYSLGLRLGEGLALQIGDIDAVRHRVHIRDAKGNKDRFVPLPETTLSLLRRFWTIHRNPTWLFPSRARGLKGSYSATRPLDRGGIQTTMRQVVLECGIKKRLPCIACATVMRPT